MDISVFGAGYVGLVVAACLSRDGHHVVAVDIHPDKVKALASGRSPIVEPGLDALIRDGVSSQRLRATADPYEAVAQTSLSFICVGTPSLPNGGLDTSYVGRTAEQIGAALAKKNDFHAVVGRSTMLPGTMDELVIPTLERTSQKRAGTEFGVAYYPEFLRESSAIEDYDKPGAIVLGVRDDTTRDQLLELNARIPVKPRIMTIRSAEAVKYVNNAWHALKISFSNEIGLIAKALEIDSFDLMEALCADTKLNISTAYLKPGFAFGGSCLPKDLRALRRLARERDVGTPILDATLLANENQIDSAYQMITATGKRRIGLIGLSFKPGTDDLRESPLVELSERLIGRGYNLRIFDPNIRLSQLMGANRAYVFERLPHIAELLADRGSEVVNDSDVIVIGNKKEALPLMDQIRQEGKIAIDVVRIDRQLTTRDGYQGLCW